MAELGELSIAAFELRPTPRGALPTETPWSGAADPLLTLADLCPEPIAVFDEEGRCLLRNGLFASLLGSNGLAIPGNAALSAISDARGREAEWLTDRLARAVRPVGIYRVCRADGTWICVEERRTPAGRSLIARFEAAEAYGGDLDGAALFERCPSPIGPVGPDPEQECAGHGFAEPERWVHLNPAGEARHVAGRTAALTFRGRPSVLVAVTTLPSFRTGQVAA